MNIQFDYNQHHKMKKEISEVIKTTLHNNSHRLGCDFERQQVIHSLDKRIEMILNKVEYQYGLIEGGLE